MVGDGKRASQTVAGATTRYVYDALGGLPTLLDDGARKYVWGLGLAYAVGGTSIEVYHGDGLGSVRATTDAAGWVTHTQRTDEYGVPTETTGGGGQPFGFTGEQRDATGLVYLRARMYDPNVGRFMQRDTHPGGKGDPASQHRYAYVANNPVNATDPSGHIPEKFNRALRQRGYSDHCFVGDREGDGTHVTVIGCINMHGLMIYQFIVQMPNGPRIITGVSLASPDGGNGEGRGGENDPADSKGRPSISAIKRALEQVYREVEKLPKDEPGKFGSPSRGTPRKGYRLDPGHPDRPPGDPEEGWHLNWWDYSTGKKSSGGRRGAIPIEE
jgi:RHS repeat-associated protein